MRKTLLGLALVLGGTPVSMQGAVLQPETLRAWREYVAAADLRMKARVNGQIPFLWTDESPERRRRVFAGNTVIAPVVGGGYINVADGLIHHWIGAIFIPHTTLQQVITVLHEYGRYKEFYRPFVADSGLCSAVSWNQEFSLIFQYRMMFGTLVIEGRYVANDFALDATRRYTITSTALVQEVEGYGTGTERLLTPGSGSGFLWNLRTVVRYKQAEGGVYVELEVLALSRTIPGALRWFVNPLVRRMAMNCLDAALERTRNAVMAPPATREEVSQTASRRIVSLCNCARPAGVAPSRASK